MCDDVADVLVVNVASHIWGEGGPQVLHLRERERGELYLQNGDVYIDQEGEQAGVMRPETDYFPKTASCEVFYFFYTAALSFYNFLNLLKNNVSFLSIYSYS